MFEVFQQKMKYRKGEKKKSETKMGKREKEGSYGKAHGPRQYVADEW